MDYKMLCPDCSAVFNNNRVCSECCSTRECILVYEPLIKAVTMLIKMGIGVTDTTIRCHTSHKLVVTIHLADALPDGVLSGLLGNWMLQGSKLSCTEINQDNTKGSNQLMYSKMISSLEDYLTNKDIDGTKAVMRLSGYVTGQV